MKHRWNNKFFPAVIALIFSVTMLACSTAKQAADSSSQEAITTAINNDDWVFTAQNISPQYGSTRIVNGLYQFAFSKDTIVSYLPYLGRSYGGAYLFGSRGPLDFTDTGFRYSKEQDKNGRWTVTIKPNDNREVQSMVFTLYDNGSSQLNVTLNNRTPVSYSGYIRNAN
ncbi:MAG TPA: DUF4251 domain-containing protein [Chitinophagaceae bacterium]|nr:DUF4251 domain-containing protein [Chitinophagaceae bacterium]